MGSILVFGAVILYAVALLAAGALVPLDVLSFRLGFAAVAAAFMAMVLVRCLRGGGVRRAAVTTLALALGLALAWLASSVTTATPTRCAEQLAMAQYAGFAVAAVAAWQRRWLDPGSYAAALAATVAVAALDESIQSWVPGRQGLLGDLACPLVGSVIALALHAVASGAWRLEASAATVRASAWSLATCTIALAGLLHVAHLGYRIQGPDLETFRSRIHPADLARLATTWQPRDPATDWWSRLRLGEDRYEREARWHMARRERFRAAEDVAGVREAEQILARHFGLFVRAERLEISAAPIAYGIVGEGPDVGPPYILIGVDPWTLWLCAIALASGLGLAGEVWGSGGS